MKPSLFRLLFIAVSVLALAACNQADMIQKFASPADQALAKGYLDLLRQQRFDELEKAADPSIAGSSLHASLARMATFIPPGEPSAITLVGAHRMTSGDASTADLTWEYGFSGQWILMSVAVKNQGGKASITGLSVVPQPASLEAQNRFTLTGKAPLQYAVFVLAVVFPLLSLAALVVCIRTRLQGRKWPWILFILLGLGELSVNWTTGAWSLNALAVQLFSASAFAPLYGAWTFAVSLPLGAIVFLVLRSKLGIAAIQNGLPPRDAQ